MPLTLVCPTHCGVLRTVQWPTYLVDIYLPAPHLPASQLGIPALVMMATMDDNYRKPSTGMWDLMCSRLNGGVVPGGFRVWKSVGTV